MSTPLPDTDKEYDSSGREGDIVPGGWDPVCSGDGEKARRMVSIFVELVSVTLRRTPLMANMSSESKCDRGSSACASVVIFVLAEVRTSSVLFGPTGWLPEGVAGTIDPLCHIPLQPN